MSALRYEALRRWSGCVIGAVYLLAVVFVMFAPEHSRPLPSFWVEWGVVCILCVAALISPPGPEPARLHASSVLALPLVALFFACLFSSGFSFESASTGYAAYVIVFLGAYAFSGLRPRSLAKWLAVALLCIALGQSVLVGLQVMGVESKAWLPLAGGRAVGSVGQPNLLADLILCGAASLAHPQFANIQRGLRLLLALLLGLVLAATASRMGMLASVLLVGLAIWVNWRRPNQSARTLLESGLTLIAAQLLYAGLPDVGLLHGHTGFVRFGPASSDGIRLYFAQTAIEAIQQSPWLGHGAGSFWEISVDAMQRLPARGFKMLVENAHNLPLNLAAEFGVPITTLVCGGVVWWWFEQLRSGQDENLWALACVAVVSLHSLTEYPLWYAYILLPCALCMGIVDASSDSRQILRFRLSVVGSRAVQVSGAVGLAVCVWTFLDWTYIRLATQQLDSAGPITARIMSASARAEVEQVPRFSILAPQAQSLRLRSYSGDMDASDSRRLKEADEDCARNWKHRPTWFMLKSCGEIFAASAREEGLSEIVQVQCKGYPDQHARLREWASELDQDKRYPLRVSGRACL